VENLKDSNKPEQMIVREQVTETRRVEKPRLWQVIAMAVLLASATILTLGLCLWGLARVESVSVPEVTVEWKNETQASLKSGPPSFWYDQQKGVLHHRGPIPKEEKETLTKLSDDAGYRAALDELAYESQTPGRYAFLWLLLLGGMGAVLGVQVRSINDFIGHFCYRDTLDIGKWWPWYFLRPVLGFLIGFVVVALVKSDLLASARKEGGDSTLWWIGLAVVAGFGADDVVRRLRLLSKTFFGTERSTMQGD
jgi:hypothetical protein